MKPKNRIRLKQWLKKSISFRTHMSLITMLTILIGFYVNLLLLNSSAILYPGIRYPVVVLFSYGLFLLLIRLYLKQFFENKSYLDSADITEFPADLPTRGERGPEMVWEGGGGQFSGGGATGDWSDGSEVIESDSFDLSEVASDDGLGLILGFVLVGGLSILFGSSVYLIWHSPEILSELFLQIILTSGVRRKFKKVAVKDWVGHLFKMSKYPLLLAFIVSILFGIGLKKFCPEANSLKDYRAQCWRSY